MKKNRISKNWINKQRRDIYVRRSKVDGYRSRSAYKLIEIDEKFKIFKNGISVIDLGSAPGSWSQYLSKKIKNSKIVSIDLREMEAIDNTIQVLGDFTEKKNQSKINDFFKSNVDVVLSDMAASASGHRQTDHLKIMALAEAGAYFAHDVLTPGGTYCAKVLQGGAEADLLKMLKKDFKVVRHVKPEASRSDSAEMYVLATGFRGREEDGADE